MLLEFLQFFERRKMRIVGFGEPSVTWSGGHQVLYSIVFYENGYGKRKYTIEEQNTRYGWFYETQERIQCETWKRTGTLPKWAVDKAIKE